jgi:hypothetical protein
LPTVYENNEGVTKKGPRIDGPILLPEISAERFEDKLRSGEIVCVGPVPVFARPLPRRRATRPWAVQKLTAFLKAHSRQMTEAERRAAAKKVGLSFTDAEWRKALAEIPADLRRRPGRPGKLR